MRAHKAQRDTSLEVGDIVIIDGTRFQVVAIRTAYNGQRALELEQA